MKNKHRYFALVCATVMVGIAFVPMWATDNATAHDVNMTQYPQAWFATGNYYNYENAALYDFAYASVRATIIHSYPKPGLLYTRGFTEPNPGDYPYGDVYWPPVDATIISMNTVAVVKNQGPNVIAMSMGYSTGISEMYYTEKAVCNFPVAAYEGTLAPASIWYNITALEAWTPDMVMSNSTWAAIKTTGNTAYEDILYVDYLGIVAWWTQPDEGGPGGLPHEDEPVSWDNETAVIPTNWTWGLGNDTVNGFFFIVGFIGMIAIPPGAYLIARNAENRVVTGIKFLMAFLVCFALFLGSIM